MVLSILLCVQDKLLAMGTNACSVEISASRPSVFSILLLLQTVVTFGDALLFLNPQPSSVGTGAWSGNVCWVPRHLTLQLDDLCCVGFGVWESVSPDTALFYVKTLKISEEHFTQWEVHYQGTTCLALARLVALRVGGFPRRQKLPFANA